MDKNQRETWIDALKFFAIFAVIIDHTYGYLYTNIILQKLTFFSVAVFFFLSGSTMYYSTIKRIDETYMLFFLRRLKNIFLPYSIAILIKSYIDEGMKLVLVNYVKSLFSFSGIYYYVLVYIELLLVGGLLCRIVIKLKGCTHLLCKYIFTGTIILCFSVWSINYTYVIPTFGAGQYLFGGTCILVYYLGIIFAEICNKWNIINKGILGQLVVSICAIVCLLVLWTRLDAINDTPVLINGVNPPGIIVILYAILVIVAIRSLDLIINSANFKYIKKIWSLFCWIGQRSLWIYLLHTLFLKILKDGYLNFMTSGTRLFCILLIVFAGCIAISEIFELTKKGILFFLGTKQVEH